MKMMQVQDVEKIPFHLVIDARDNVNQGLSTYFDQTFEFIDKHLETTNVFVHCLAGISRSSTVVIAYLMRKFRWRLEKTLKFVKEKRG